MFQKIYFFTFLLFSLSYNSWGQKITLEVTGNKNILSELKSINFEKTHRDTTSVKQALKNIQKYLEFKGYISLKKELIKKNDTLYIANLKTNKHIETVELFLETESQQIKLPILNKNNTITIPFSELPSFLQKLKNNLDSKGNSFSEIQLNNIQLKQNKLSASINIKSKSSIRTIDTILSETYPKLPKKIIHQHLKLKPNSIFNKEKLIFASSQLKTLNFITELKPPEVLFTKDSTYIYMYVRKKKANKFDGIIGFSNNDDSNKLIFNGYLDISLINNFNKGEVFSLYWSNNGKDQQLFQLYAFTPYIYNSPFSPSIRFKIYKQNTSFIEISSEFNLDYSLNASNILKLILTTNSSNNLDENENQNIQSFTKTLYGLSYRYQSKQKLLNFPKLEIELTFNSGKRKTDTSNQNQYALKLKSSYIQKLNRRNYIYLENNTETLITDNLLFNELFRIGGANSMRGFIEQSLFVSSYSYTNLEYRLLTDTKSYLYTFSDIGFTDNTISKTKNRLYSFGLGYSYQTNGGIISLNYAIGKTNGDSFNFNKGIFHIKLVNYF